LDLGQEEPSKAPHGDSQAAQMWPSDEMSHWGGNKRIRIQIQLQMGGTGNG